MRLSTFSPFHSFVEQGDNSILPPANLYKPSLLLLSPLLLFLQVACTDWLYIELLDRVREDPLASYLEMAGKMNGTDKLFHSSTCRCTYSLVCVCHYLRLRLIWLLLLFAKSTIIS